MNTTMKNFRYACSLLALSVSLIFGNGVWAWAQPPEYIPAPVDPSTFPKPSPEVIQMVDQWKEDFLKLKSLQMTIKSFTSGKNSGQADLRLLGKETFAYDNPQFLEDVTLFNDDTMPKEMNGKSTFSYDGHYYYSSIEGFGSPDGGTMRAPKLDASWPPVTLNTLLYLFQFVINGTDPKYFCSLTDPSVWDNFARRVTDFKKDAHTGEVTFSCENYDSKYEPTTTFDVKATPIDGVLVPVSMEQTDVVLPEGRTEMAVTDFNKDAKSTFGMPFPMRISVAGYHKGVLIPQTQSVVEVEAKSLAINQPVTATFTLTDDSMTDTDILGLPPERK